MNHLKIFELFISKDYVKVSDLALKYMDLYPIVKILGKKAYAKKDAFIPNAAIRRDKRIIYKVEGIDNKTNKLRILNMTDQELGDIASQEEIEEYELTKSANKYNL